MPLYEYRCQACERQFEVIRKFSDPELDVCALCGKGPIERLVSSPAIQFKGSGFYITDYARKGESGKGEGAKKGGGGESASPSGDAGSEAKKSDAAPATAPAASTPTTPTAEKT